MTNNCSSKLENTSQSLDRKESLEIYRTLIEDWRCAEEISERFKSFLEIHCGLNKWLVEDMHDNALKVYDNALHFNHHRKTDRYRLFVYVNTLVNELQTWFEKNELDTKDSAENGLQSKRSLFKNQVGFLIQQVAMNEQEAIEENNLKKNNMVLKTLALPEIPYLEQLKYVFDSTGQEKSLALRKLFHDYLTTLKDHSYTLRGTEHETVILACVVDNIY